jgi:YD repeat-containing protein
MTATYVWDADNRLAAVVPDRLRAGAQKLVFAYDYQGRRVRKTV